MEIIKQTEMQNKLTIHHLAKRLPYGLIGMSKWGGAYILNTYSSMKGKGIEDRDVNSFLDGVLKPVLFPLSALTQEITVNGETFVPIKKMKDWYNSLPNAFISKLSFVEDYENFVLFGLEENDSYEVSMPYRLYEFLHQYHIDYENLISSGLAISVFDLPENPYK